MPTGKREKPLLDEARELATTYNERATEFSERIKTFQSWVQRLEFRVRANVEFDMSQERYRLSFMKWNDEWGLCVFERDLLGEWDALGGLENCSVAVKVAAALAFPALLANLIAAQREALNEINAAHIVLDAMAEKIGSFEEEGE